jgi:hypothetical protein
VKPPNSDSCYYDYKAKNSIVLLPVVNANHEFIVVHTGTSGKVSDEGVLHVKSLYDKVMDGSLKLPAPETPDGTRYSILPTLV